MGVKIDIPEDFEPGKDDDQIPLLGWVTWDGRAVVIGGECGDDVGRKQRTLAADGVYDPTIGPPQT
jgi:hypothetical protein